MIASECSVASKKTRWINSNASLSANLKAALSPSVPGQPPFPLKGSMLRHDVYCDISAGPCLSDARAASEIHPGSPRSQRRAEDHLSDNLCALFPVQHVPNDNRPILRISDIIANPLVITRRNSSVRVLFERSMSREGCEISITMETNCMSIALSMARARAGVGVAILPRSATKGNLDGTAGGLRHRHLRRHEGRLPGRLRDRIEATISFRRAP
jgi:DNA-binding transcriptional LysR family regulator